MKIYLASKSPRRQALLKQIDIPYELINSEVDESIKQKESALDYCLRVAQDKAIAGWNHPSRSLVMPVLAADTTVVLNDTILTKPKDDNDAAAMLEMLSNRTHQVITAVVVKLDSRLELTKSITDVSFDTMTLEQIQSYIKSGESLGRAGAYSIQGKIARFINHLSGSYTGVVGLPVYETSKLLNNFIP